MCPQAHKLSPQFLVVFGENDLSYLMNIHFDALVVMF